jgi:hypothetical protein
MFAASAVTTCVRLVALGCCLAGVVPAAEQSYCAFQVKVTRPDGKPAAGIAAGMSQGGMALAEKLTDAGGIAEFCDAPATPVDIFVGFASCGLVVNKQVEPLWLHTREVYVVYDRSHCSEFGPSPTECHVLLRVRDESGKPLPGAVLTQDQARGAGQPADSDSFGRLFFTAAEGGTIRGTITRQGYKPETFLQHCALRESDADREVTVVLRPQQ